MIKEMNNYIKALSGLSMDLPGQMTAMDKVVASGITVNEKPVAFSYVPMVVTPEDMADFQAVIDGITPILDKMTRHYIEDPSYRAVFGFSKEMEDLICLPCDYPCVIPFGRYDLFYDFESDRYGFCEINTDGSGGMSWNDYVTEAILDSMGDQAYLDKEGIRPFRAVEAFARGIMEIYRSSPQAVEDPLIAIVDFKEEGVGTDFACIIDALKKLGVRARFTDIRDLELADREGNTYSPDSRLTDREDIAHISDLKDDSYLVDRNDGAIIHGIYRRAVTSVVLDRYEECQVLIEAVRRNKVVLMGHFRTSLAHSKTVFAAMYHPKTLSLLTEEEIAWVKAHIPATYILREAVFTGETLSIQEADFCQTMDSLSGQAKDSGQTLASLSGQAKDSGQTLASIYDETRDSRPCLDLDLIRQNKDAWVLKPEEGFGSYGVVCGMDVSDEEWADFLKDALNKPYILQAFCPRYTIPVVASGSDKVDDYPLMLGIFQTGGRVAGCYNRAGKAGVIDYSHGCVCVGTGLLCNSEKDSV